jgi:hypothetical protein
MSGALSRDTTVKWAASPGAVRYRVRWRRTDAPSWTGLREVTATQTLIPQVPVDDYFFGVSAVGPDGAESLVSFAGRERPQR